MTTERQQRVLFPKLAARHTAKAWLVKPFDSLPGPAGHSPQEGCLGISGGLSAAGLGTPRTAWLRVWLAWLREVAGEPGCGSRQLWSPGRSVLHCDFARRHQQSQEPFCKSLHGCQAQLGRVILAEHCHGTGGTFSSPPVPIPRVCPRTSKAAWFACHLALTT